MTQFIKPAIGVIALAIIAVLIFNVVQTKQGLPEQTFTDLDGKTHSFEDFKGKPLLVIFWATDCPACVQELPELKAVYKEYAPKGLGVVSIALAHDKPEHLLAMRLEKQIPYLISWDKTGELADAFNNVRVTPTHFLYSADGDVVMRKIGSVSKEMLSEKLSSMGL
ncbi:MAG: TlpA disulfide reductase family protein [Pseudomonadota bacterium]|jgi:thiol-disulfide isomerase/thioredoxin|uniref:TlpA family protein disulfide reductase n=1 Tax=Methylophaga aminisulfidivorans TaxID=230105 RepID=UPI0024E26CBC|nr:TlpA disulfide reductase family protein [Methylophaga aminisulfidivorans]MEC9412810.1 TlpA disulfide reductase family protein [Pseudomonadota bacterium]